MTRFVMNAQSRAETLEKELSKNKAAQEYLHVDKELKVQELETRIG